MIMIMIMIYSSTSAYCTVIVFAPCSSASKCLVKLIMNVEESASLAANMVAYS